mgnify:CR=1 FL=1
MIKELVIKLIEHDITKHQNKHVIYVTQVTQCLRKSYYEIKHKAVNVDYELSKHLILGKSIHLWLQELLKKYGNELNIKYCIEKDIKFMHRGYMIKGRADIVINDVLVELKTTHKSIHLPDRMHVLQANEYAYQLGLQKYVILYVTPNGLIEFKFTTDRYKHFIFIHRLETLIDALEMDELPEKETGYECKYCPFRNKCLYRKLIHK